MSKRIAAIAAIACAGCATTYQAPPATAYQPQAAPITATQAQLMRAARVALTSLGYSISSADDGSGTITTSPRAMHLSSQEANCGTTMGINYLDDKRTSTSVAIGIVAADNSLLVRSTVSGEYKPGSVSQDITLTCYSLGAVEGQVRAAIAQTLGH